MRNYNSIYVAAKYLCGVYDCIGRFVLQTTDSRYFLSSIYPHAYYLLLPLRRSLSSLSQSVRAADPHLSPTQHSSSNAISDRRESSLFSRATEMDFPQTGENRPRSADFPLMKNTRRQKCHAGKSVTRALLSHRFHVFKEDRIKESK